MPIKLQQLVPNSSIPIVDLLPALNKWLPTYNINTTERLCQFMAQACHETGGFKWLTELGGPSYFKKYDGRKDLGNVYPGDGYKYRGRGIFQLTGRANYTTMAAQTGLDLVNHPEYAANINPAIQIACLYWNKRNLSALADKGDIRGITKAINGGYNGLQDRIAWYNKCKSLIS